MRWEFLVFVLILMIGLGSCVEWEEHLIDSSYPVDTLSCGDFDGDRDNDLFVSREVSSIDLLYFYENIGDNFDKIASDLPLPVQVLDFDGDGDLDFVSGHGGYSTYIISLAENDGFGSFDVVTFKSAGLWITDLFAGDMDGDGDNDFVTLNHMSDNLYWHEYNGSGILESHLISNSFSNVFSLDVLDFDGDGDLDVLVEDSVGGKRVLLCFENSDGSFVEREVLSNVPSNLFFVDFDLDGDLDFLFENDSVGLAVCYNDDFVCEVDYISVDIGELREVVDFDLDGDFDLFSSYSDSFSLYLHENDGEGVFVSSLVFDSFAGKDSLLSFFDFDLDGDLDIFFGEDSMFSSAKFYWYESDLFDEGFCNGSLSVFVRDGDGNFLEGLVVEVNGESFVSDEFGEVEVDLGCGDYDLEVFCSDGEVVCGERSGVVSGDGDVDSFVFVCDVCKSGRDVWVREDDVEFERVNSGLAVSVEVGGVGVDEEVNVSLVRSCGGVLSLVGVEVAEVGDVVWFWDEFDGCEGVEVLVSGVEGEDVVSNNEVEVDLVWPLRVFLVVDSGNDFVDLAVEDFLEDELYVVSSEAEAEVVLYVGRGLYDGVYLEDGLIRFGGVRDGFAWDGVVDFEGDEVFVFGNEVEGLVRGLVGLVDGDYLDVRRVGSNVDLYFGWDDLDGVRVSDFLRFGENGEVYGEESAEFEAAVGRALVGDFFEMSVRRVETGGGSVLRLKSLSAEFSEGLGVCLDVVGRPVIMAGGLFSDLEAWEGEDGDGLAFDLANNGKDVWEVELTGGELVECDDCLDYTYDDLVEEFWPALVGAVQYLSGVVSVDYVGHSNGCRVALSSLAKYQESGLMDVGYVDGVGVDLEGSETSRVVEVFVGVGCPGAFEGESLLKEYVRKNPNNANELEDDGKTHVTRDDIMSKLTYIGLPGETASISLSLWKYYVNAIIYDEDSQPGGFDVDKLRLIYGIGGINSWIGSSTDRDDGMVIENDSIAIADTITSSNSDKLNYYKENHVGLTSNNDIKMEILEFLE